VTAIPLKPKLHFCANLDIWLYLQAKVIIVLNKLAFTTCINHIYVHRASVAFLFSILHFNLSHLSIYLNTIYYSMNALICPETVFHHRAYQWLCRSLRMYQMRKGAQTSPDPLHPIIVTRSQFTHWLLWHSKKPARA